MCGPYRDVNSVIQNGDMIVPLQFPTILWNDFLHDTEKSLALRELISILERQDVTDDKSRFLNFLTKNSLYKITINETGEFVLKIENKYAKDYLIAPDKETDFVIFAFSNQEYEKILQSIQSINNAQSSVYLSMKEIEKYEKASSYNLQLTYINADNQVKNSTIQIENNDNKLTMLG